MKLRVKDNALDRAGKFDYFTIEPPVACYEPYLNRNSLENSPFIYKLLDRKSICFCVSTHERGRNLARKG